MLPDRPGWYWMRYENHERPVVVNVFSDSGGNLGHWDNRWYPVEQMQWLAQVPSAEAVQAAVEALGNAKYEIRECARDRNVDKVVSKINKAITGLTGGEEP